MIELDRLASLRKKERALVQEIRHDIKQTDRQCPVAYLPVPTPKHKADYILVAAEPSLGRWAKNNEGNACQMVEKGFKSFMWSWEDFIFLYSVEHFLSASHHVTDVSKAAMPVKLANRNRNQIYPRWLGLLQEEIEVIGTPECRLISVGTASRDFLERQLLPRNLERGWLWHYSRQNKGKWKETADAPESNFHHFEDNLMPGPGEILRFAEDYMRGQRVDPGLIEEIVTRLGHSTVGLDEPRRQLMFTCYQAFNRIKDRRV